MGASHVDLPVFPKVSERSAEAPLAACREKGQPQLFAQTPPSRRKGLDRSDQIGTICSGTEHPYRYLVSALFREASPERNVEGVDFMLAVAISLLFGLVAFAALAQIRVSVSRGLRHGRLILAELSSATTSGEFRPMRRAAFAAA
jgi:hypothetical protein